MTTAAVVLAAGGGSRFDGPGHKLLAPLRGRPVLAWVVDAVTSAGFDEVIVVTGAADVSGLLEGLTVVHNDRWAEGQATSLAAAVDQAERSGHDAVVVGLGDQPGVESEAWRRVAASRAPIAVATYDGRMRNPVRLASEVWPDLPREGDRGARAIFGRWEAQLERVACPGEPFDVDTAEDLQRWS